MHKLITLLDQVEDINEYEEIVESLYKITEENLSSSN